MRAFLVIFLMLFPLRAFCTEVPLDSPQPAAITGQEFPRVAAGRDGYLAVWRDYRANGETYAARIDRNGAVLDPLGLRIAAGQAMLAVVAVPDGYLVVAAVNCSSIDAIFVSTTGAVSPPVHVADAGGQCVDDLEAATNGDTVLVVWNGNGALLDAKGGVIRGALAFGASYRMAVASNGSDYLVGSLVLGGPASNVWLAPVSRRGEVGTSQVIGPYLNSTGVAIASDGEGYLVVVTGVTLSLQRVDPAGSHAAQAGHIDHGTTSSQSPRVAWNGLTFGIAFSTSGSPANRLNIARATRDGTPVTPLVSGAPLDQQSTSDIAPAADGFLIIWTNMRALAATLAGADALNTPTLPPAFTVAMAARAQIITGIGMAAGRIVAVWVERYGDTFELRARMFSSARVPLTGATDVSTISFGSMPSFAIAYDGKYVIIGWTDGPARIRRYTIDLMAVDPEPVAIGSPADSLTMAAANGVTLAAFHSIRGLIATTLVDTGSERLAWRSIALRQPRYYDHAGTVTWNGVDFALVCATATGPPPTQGLFPDPPDDIVGFRITASGAVVDTTPVPIAHLAYPVYTISAAANGLNRYIAWTADTYARSVAASMFGMLIDANLIAMRDPVALSGSDAVAVVTVVPRDNGYVVAWPAVEETLAYHSTIKARALDSSGTPIAFAHLSPRETGYYSANTVGVVATELGLVVGYDRLVYDSSVGGVSRAFLDEFGLQPERRRAVGLR